MGKIRNVPIFLSVMVAAAAGALAQSSNGTYTITQEAVSSGGGSIGGGNPMSAQTILGLPAGGAASNGTYTLLGGIQPVTGAAAAPMITVIGTIDDATAAVTVNSMPATIGGSTFTAQNVQLVFGSNTLTAIATDPAGNQRTSSITVTVVNPTPPPMPTVGTVGTPPPPVTTASSITIGGTKTVGTSIWINGTQAVAADSQTTWSAAVSLTEGDNVFTIVTKDAQGKASAPATLNIIKDALPPVITFAPPAKTNLTPALLSGSVDDSLTTVTINGIATTRTGRNFEALVPLVLGANTLTVRAVSPNNYVATQSAAITLGTIPTISAISLADRTKAYAGSATSMQITASDAQNDPIEYRLLLDGQPLAAWSASNTQTWTPATADIGPHTLAAEARDAYGGSNTTSVSVYVVRPPVQHP